MNDEVRRKYGDIINLPHHQSGTRPRMSNYDRAAQFSPFATLTGHVEAIKETVRLTEEYVEPSEELKAAINDKIVFLMGELENNPEVTVTYFKPDERKSGGEYVTVTGTVKKIKTYERKLLMTAGDVIPFDVIFEIGGGIFDFMDY